jgi:hypothetical protein
MDMAPTTLALAASGYGSDDAATRRTNLNIPTAFSFNHPYFNGLFQRFLYFNGSLFQRSYISTSGDSML